MENNTATNSQWIKFIAVILFAISIIACSCMFSLSSIMKMQDTVQSQGIQAVTQPPSPTPTPLSISEEDYERIAGYAIEEYANSLEQCAKITEVYEPTDEWSKRQLSCLQRLDNAASRIEQLPQPPMKYKEFDSYIKLLPDETYMFTNNFRIGITTGDIEALQRTLDNMDNIINIFEMANKSLE